MFQTGYVTKYAMMRLLYSIFYAVSSEQFRNMDSRPGRFGYRLDWSCTSWMGAPSTASLRLWTGAHDGGLEAVGEDFGSEGGWICQRDGTVIQ
jgi:hypothetical protein